MKKVYVLYDYADISEYEPSPYALLYSYPSFMTAFEDREQAIAYLKERALKMVETFDLCNEDVLGKKNENELFVTENEEDAMDAHRSAYIYYEESPDLIVWQVIATDGEPVVYPRITICKVELK